MPRNYGQRAPVRSSTVHELPVWIRSTPERIDAYDAPTIEGEWLAGAVRDGAAWVTGDGASRSGRCDNGQEARTDVQAMAESVLYARHLHRGTLELRQVIQP